MNLWTEQRLYIICNSTLYKIKQFKELKQIKQIKQLRIMYTKLKPLQNAIFWVIFILL